MKTVQSGAHYTTVTVDTAEEVKFSFASTSLSVEASGGDITVALTETAQAGDDETITVPDGESRMLIHHRMGVDTYYLTGSGTATLYASNMGDVNPFKGKAKGGDGGGDSTHYKGTTTTALENGSTTNPIVIDGESYTAVFGDVVVYGYTEFVFDGTAWSEFGRPFDTVPTEGSTNAVTSDGIYKRIPLVPDSVTATGYKRRNGNGTARGVNSWSLGTGTTASNAHQTAIGIYNGATMSDSLFVIGNGTANDSAHRSNILDVSRKAMNVNGDIQINNVAIPTPYTTMPTITADMLGKIAMYVGATGNGYTQGCFYIAATDGAAEPTYSWVKIGGGGRTETVLWENDGTTNPETITLSEAWSNFDELVVTAVSVGTVVTQNETTRHTSIMVIGGVYTMWYNSESTWGTYSATSSTVLTKTGSGGDYHIQKIIGIKY